MLGPSPTSVWEDKWKNIIEPNPSQFSSLSVERTIVTRIVDTDVLQTVSSTKYNNDVNNMNKR